MPTVRINGVDIEVPRHVHRADGTSKIVWTEDECVAACADGWHPVPPSAAAPAVDLEVIPPPVLITAESIAALPPAFVEQSTPDRFAVGQDEAAVSRTGGEAQSQPSAHPKRGRPRKVQP